MIVSLTDARRRRTVEMFNAGATYAEIAAELHITVGALAQWLNRHGYRRKAPRRQYTPEQARRAIELRKAGASYRAITAETGLYFPVLRKLFKTRGLTQCRNGRHRETSLPATTPESAYEPMPVFPEFDDLELNPEHRKRLEEVRRRRIAAWWKIHGGKVTSNT